MVEGAKGVMETARNTIWERTIHHVATRIWAVAVFGDMNIHSMYRGGDWLPIILNPVDDRSWIELPKGATRRDFIDLWRILTGKRIDDEVLNEASKVCREARS